MRSLIIKNAFQSVMFGIMLSLVYYFNGNATELNEIAKNFVVYAVVFFAISMAIDVLFKKNRK